MILTAHLKKEVIIPALRSLEPYIPFSDQAVNLLLGTCATESGMGKYLVQVGGGPALGIFQMEPKTFNDIFNNFLIYRYGLQIAALKFVSESNAANADALTYNLRFAAAMARIHYFRAPGALPPSNDVNGMALYWKTHYNTSQGAGEIGDFASAYNKLVLPYL